MLISWAETRQKTTAFVIQSWWLDFSGRGGLRAGFRLIDLVKYSDRDLCDVGTEDIF